MIPDAPRRGPKPPAPQTEKKRLPLYERGWREVRPAKKQAA